MKISALTGMMDWRILINFKTELKMLREYLPAPFEPRNHLGFGMAGVCLLNQRNQRIKGLPSALGLHSYQALYWIAVNWEELGETRQGYYIPVRYTSSLLQVAAGGRGYPGLFRLARFKVDQTDQRVKIRMQARDGAELQLEAKTGRSFPSGSVMRGLPTSQAFFQGPMLSVSPRYKQLVFDRLELQAGSSPLEPLRIEALDDTFFKNISQFSPRSVLFDHALIQTGGKHEWVQHPEILAPRPWHNQAYSTQLQER
jgi:hypothetical protein